MKSAKTRALALALLCGSLLVAGTAQAHGGRDWPEYGGHHEYRPHRHGHDHGHRMFRAPPPPVAYGVAPYPYYAPAPVYRRPSSPALVIGVDIPPLVIPLR